MSEEDTPTPGRGPRAIVADDDPLVRRLVRDALQGAGFTVAADAANGREAVERTLYYEPDIVVMDVQMPELDGISAAREITSAAPGVCVVLLTHSDDHEVGLRGLEAGAAGFLTKDLDIVRLPEILQGVMAGTPAVSPGLTRTLIDRLRALSVPAAGMRPVRSDLTSREWEVLDLLAAGRSNDEVADDLVLSAETVRTHIKSLHRKLDVHSREELIGAAKRLRSPGA